MPPQKVRERGDKVVTLDSRLDTIEGKIVRLEARVNRLFAMMTLLVGIVNTPSILGEVNKLLGH
jgi:hypothetical protein